jgi:hypothetical protein
VMWQRIMVITVLVLTGCAAERMAERNAPDLSFQGPVHPVTLSSSQIKLVQQGVAEGLKDRRSLAGHPPLESASFGGSYRAGISSDGEIVVCGYVSGKKFVGMFAKPKDGTMQFLPIGVSISEEEEDAVRPYCRADGIYLPK